MDPYVSGKLANMHKEIGDIYASIGRINEARNEYEKALRLRPDYIDVWVKIGNIVRDSKEYGKAIEIYNKAKALGKNFPPLGVNLGITYYLKGDKEKAQVEWSKVLETDPENKMARSYVRLVKK